MKDPLNISDSHNTSDEINLKEKIIILKQQKKIIIGAFLICLAISVAMMATTKPVYESRAVIAIGQIGQQGLQGQIQQRQIEEPVLFVQRLQESNQISDSSAFLSTVEIDKKAANNVVILKTTGNGAEETQKLLNTIVAQIVQEHDKVYNVDLVAHQQRLAFLEQQMKNLEIEINTYSNFLSTNVNAKDPSAMLIVLEKSKAESRRMDTEKQLTEEKSTIELQLKPTKVFREATLPVTPIKPKPIYITGGIVGLLLGMMLAFVRHSMQKKSNGQ